MKYVKSGLDPKTFLKISLYDGQDSDHRGVAGWGFSEVIEYSMPSLQGNKSINELKLVELYTKESTLLYNF